MNECLAVYICDEYLAGLTIGMADLSIAIDPAPGGAVMFQLIYWLVREDRESSQYRADFRSPLELVKVLHSTGAVNFQKVQDWAFGKIQSYLSEVALSL
jgi:hypothetical protein